MLQCAKTCRISYTVLVWLILVVRAHTQFVNFSIICVCTVMYWYMTHILPKGTALYRYRRSAS